MSAPGCCHATPRVTSPSIPSSLTSWLADRTHRLSASRATITRTAPSALRRICRESLRATSGAETEDDGPVHRSFGAPASSRRDRGTCLTTRSGRRWTVAGQQPRLIGRFQRAADVPRAEVDDDLVAICLSALLDGKADECDGS